MPLALLFSILYGVMNVLSEWSTSTLPRRDADDERVRRAAGVRLSRQVT